MSIEFDKYGNPSPYEIQNMRVSEFEETFAILPDKNCRGELFQGFQKYNKDFNVNSPSKWFQWIGGSFISKKEFPNDIDVVNFVDEKAMKNADLYGGFWSSDTPDSSKNIYKVDAYLEPLFPPEDPKHNITKIRMKYWQDLLEKDRDKRQKAIIQVDQI